MFESFNGRHKYISLINFVLDGNMQENINLIFNPTYAELYIFYVESIKTDTTKKVLKQ
jgi:hypothetical protein